MQSEEALRQIELSGDTYHAAKYSRYPVKGRLFLTAATIEGAVLSLGGEFSSPLLLGLTAGAMGSAAVANRIFMRKEGHDIQKAEAYQAIVREKFQQKVDVVAMPREGEKPHLSLRVYTYDQDDEVRHDKLLKRDTLLHTARTCEELGLDEVVICDKVLYDTTGMCEAYLGYQAEGRTTTSDKYLNGRMSTTPGLLESVKSRPEAANDVGLLYLKPDDLRKIAASIAPEKIQAQSSPLAAVQSLLRQHNPTHPFVVAYDAYLRAPDVADNKQRLSNILRNGIERRLDSSASLHVVRNKYGSPPVERYRVSPTFRIDGGNVHTMEYGQSLANGSKAYNAPGETKSLIAHTGYKNVEEVWNELQQPENLNADKLTLLAEVAAWEALRQESDPIITQVVRPKVRDGSAVRPDITTYFEAIAKNRHTTPNALIRRKRVVFGAIVLTNIVSWSLGATGLSDNLRDNLHENIARLRQEQLVANGKVEATPELVVTESTYRVLKTANTIAAGIGALSDRFAPPESAISDLGKLMQQEQALGRISSGFGDVMGEMNEKVIWEVDAPNPSDTQGYWVEAVQAKLIVDKNEFHPLQPYNDLRLFTDIDTSWSDKRQKLSKLPEVTGHPGKNEISVKGKIATTFSTEDGVAFNVPVLHNSKISAVSVEYASPASTYSVAASVMQRPDGTYFIIGPPTQDGEMLGVTKIQVNYTLKTHERPVHELRADRPLVFAHDHLDGTVGVFDQDNTVALEDLAIDTKQVKAALGNTALSSDPAEVAQYIRTQRAYSLTPFKDISFEERKNAGGQNYNEIFTHYGMTAAARGLMNCNVATLATLLATQGGTNDHFVKPVIGYSNQDGDPNLTGEEAHSFMVDNHKQIIDATPSVQKESKESNLVLGGLLGVAAMAGIGMALRKPLKKLAKKRRAAWLRPNETDLKSTASRQKDVDLLNALFHSNPNSPNYRAPKDAPVKALGSRYATLPVVESTELKKRIHERREKGWEIGYNAARRIIKLNKFLRRERQTI